MGCRVWISERMITGLGKFHIPVYTCVIGSYKCSLALGMMLFGLHQLTGCHPARQCEPRAMLCAENNPKMR